MTPVLSLITGTRNRQDSLNRLIRSIAAHTPMDYELVIADASDVPVEVEPDERVRILPERPKQTCSKGYNAAFRAAQGKWCLFLNDDAEVCPGYADTAIRFMEAHPNIGLGALHYSENGGPFRINSAWGVPYANFGIISKSLGDQVGWIDESIEMYGGDNSLTFRVLLAGMGVSDIPGAHIIHHSIKDQNRVENQSHRMHDNLTLTRLYMPLRDSWTATYKAHRVHTGTVPWSHGVEPKLVGVR